MNKRLSFLDIAKGFSIILVILGHIVTNENNFIRTWLYSFHMPIFFIISGLLLNFTHSKSTLKQFSIKKAKSLLLPYLSFAIINYIYLMNIAYRENYFTTQLAMNYIIYIIILCGRSAIWFLPCIFISEVSFKIIDEKIPSLIMKLIITLCIFIIPFFVKAEPDTLSLSLLRCCTAIGFITIGKNLFYIISKINLSTFHIILVFLANIILTFLNGQVDLFELKFNNPFYYTINSVIGALVVIFISKKINKNKIIEYYGKNSLIIMGTHIILIDINKRTLGYIFNSHIPVLYGRIYPIITLITITLFEIIVIYFFNTYLSVLLGKHKKNKIHKLAYK